jgi:hypothetical protein
MLHLIAKVLSELRQSGRTRCRHSDGRYTVIATVMTDRDGVTKYYRIDVRSKLN